MQRKEAKSAAAAADARQQSAIKKMEQEKAVASSQASEVIRKRKIAQRSAKNIYTDPLGIGGQADVVRKTLLGV